MAMKDTDNLGTNRNTDRNANASRLTDSDVVATAGDSPETLETRALDRSNIDRPATGTHDPDASPNRDAITGTPGSHPIGVGVGAAAAGVTGAAIGSVVPGIGTVTGAVVGAVIGAVSGGLAGKGVAEAFYPTEEDAYWKSEFPNREYAKGDHGYTYEVDYRDAYRFGYLSAFNYGTAEFEDVEPQLIDEWTKQHGTSRLEWSTARSAVKDAWTRARQNRPNAEPVGGETYRDSSKV
jgi:hypothetical protein